MIALGAVTRVFLALEPVDGRKGFDGLFNMVRTRLQGDPLSGHLFVFCNRHRDRIKILYWDGSGFWLSTKRLVKGRFSWPTNESAQASKALTSEELQLLLGGIELTQTTRKKWWRNEVNNK